MPPPDDHSSLLDVDHYCGLILQATDGLTEDSFFTDWVATAAVERWLSIIGEAVKRLTFTFREAHPEVEWRAWAGLRDIVVHAYDDVQPPQLWHFATIDVPQLRAMVREYLKEFPEL